jgi:hypothetical protein
VAFTSRRALSIGLLALSGVLLLLGLASPPVEAHEASSHDFESIPEAIEPEALGAGIEFEMFDYDSRLQLRNGSGKVVIVEGYDDEPYAKLDPDGRVFLNSLSPAFYLNQDRYARTAVDPSADATAPPSWELQADDGTLTWYDKRTHLLSSATPPGIEDSQQPQELRNWSIPLKVGGRPAKLEGTLYWSGQSEFPMAIVASLLVATFIVIGLGAVFIEIMRRGEEGNDDLSDEGSDDLSGDVGS